MDAMIVVSGICPNCGKNCEWYGGKCPNSAWREHNKIVRGNPVRVYEGIEFKRKK